MKRNHEQNEPVHIKAGDIVPLANHSSPESELLKRILQQMVENERRRVRNEFIRLMLLFFVILLCAAGSAIWLFRRVIADISLKQVGASISQAELQQAVTPRIEPAASGAGVRPAPAEDRRAGETAAAVGNADVEPVSENRAAAQPGASAPVAAAPPVPHGNTLSISIKGDIPLRAPIPKP